jgi:hypothetical protein
MARALMVAVESSAIRAIGYDAVTRTLYVTFHDGDTYAYAGVPPHEHRALATADSIGAYFNTRIRPAYECRQV